MALARSLHAATVTSEPLGQDPDGTAVDLYTITDKNIEVKVATYGARIISLSVPDKDGKMSSVVLGAPDLNGYVRSGAPAYAGAIFPLNSTPAEPAYPPSTPFWVPHPRELERARVGDDQIEKPGCPILASRVCQSLS